MGRPAVVLLEGQLELAPMNVAIVWLEQQLGEVLADNLLAAIAEHKLGGRIELEQPSSGVERDDGIVQGGDQRPVTSQRFAQQDQPAAALDRRGHVAGHRSQEIEELVIRTPAAGRLVERDDP